MSVNVFEQTAVNLPPEVTWDQLTYTQHEQGMWEGVDWIDYKPAGPHQSAAETEWVEPDMEMSMHLKKVARFGGLVIVRFTEVDDENFRLRGRISQAPCKLRGEFDVAVRPGETEHHSMLAFRGSFDGSLALRLAAPLLLSNLHENMQTVSRTLEKNVRVA